jgi:hypothetical protein
MSKPLTEILEQVADAGGKLLRVSRDPVPGGAGLSKRLVLIFDVGALALSSGGHVLEGLPLEPGDAPAAVDAAEEEPWWAVLGHPLTRVQEQPGGAVLVQFRSDDASPRLFLLEPSGAAVAIRLVV